MKRELTFDMIIQYHNGKLSEQESKHVKIIIDKNIHYQRILEGIKNLDKNYKEEPAKIINDAKQRFLNKFF